MPTHIPEEHPWRVKVEGGYRGAGVLLDERHVLTCAHVVGSATERIAVYGVANHTQWHRVARVVPGTWVYQGSPAYRGDVALLMLDQSAPGAVRIQLLRTPLSRREVQVYGYPKVEPNGIWVAAELGGSAGRVHDLAQLNPVGVGVQWIEPGFSGAGVVMRGAGHVGHVIGIVVQDYRNRDAKHAWMMPTETIRHYLREAISPYVSGEPAVRLGTSGDAPLELLRDDVLQVALTRELSRLLTSGWTGTVLIPGGGGTGTQWLARLVRTSDPGTRARTPDAEFNTAPRDTVLPLGTIDAAYDARGKTVAEVTRYLAERFGLPLDGPDVARELLRGKPSACIVIDGVDRAESPGELVREVLRPLAIGARSSGMRLVLGFDGKPRRTLPHQASLDPEPVEPVAGGVAGGASEASARDRVEALAAAEEEAARLSIRNEDRFRAPPALPPARAPRLRVRLAVAAAAAAGDAAADAAAAAAAEPDPEFAAIVQLAAAALGEAESFTRELRQAGEELTDLRHRLEADRQRLERHFRDRSGARDEHDPQGIRFDQLSELYKRARSALWQAPVDLVAARDLVRRYEDEGDGFIGFIGEG